MTWTKVRPRSAFIVAGDSSLYSIFEGDLRFGTTMEAGVKVRVVPLVTIEGGFERTLMFRRHQVWKWLGSVCLEGIGQWGIDRFVEQVEESSPAAVPVVHFVLKNAFTYAVYQLRKQMMNYPFDSESSMVFDSFRVSLTVVF